MNEGIERLFGDKDIFEVISRYKSMVEGKKACFFDVYEFEDIIQFYLDHENFTQASEAVKIAIKLYPFSTSIKLKYAKILYETGSAGKAFDVINEIEGVEIFNHELYLLKGSTLVKTGHYKEAIKEFDKAIKLAVEDRDEIVYEIAESFLDMGKDNLAIKYLLLAHEINEENLLVLYELGLTLEKSGYWEKSAKYYDKFLAIEPYAENVWYGLAKSCFHLEKYEEAFEAVEFALALNPSYKSAYLCKGEILLNQKKVHEAIKNFEELINLENDNFAAICHLGDCYNLLGKTEIALEYYRKAKIIDNTNPQAWYGTALIYKHNKKYQHCITNLTRAIKLDEKNSEYWFALGETYLELNQNHNATEALEKAISIDPTNYKAWLGYAQIFHNNNKVNDAINILNRAYQYNYDISTINYQLSAYYSISKQNNFAKKFFEKGLILNYNEHTGFVSNILLSLKQEEVKILLEKYQS